MTQVIQARIELERGAIAREQDAVIEQSARLVMTCANEIYDGVHRLVSQLRPPAFDRLGLRDALQDLFDDWRERFPDAGLSMLLKGELDGLDDAMATAVYRIVQEAGTNALRHAGASRIKVDLQTSGDTLLLDVSDDGTGRIDAFHLPGRCWSNLAATEVTCASACHFRYLRQANNKVVQIEDHAGGRSRCSTHRFQVAAAGCG